jgi:predicted metalloprotease
MSAADSTAEEPEVQFISFVLDDVQNTWAKILPSYGARFHPARMVLFRGSTDSGCGPAQAVMGPFYCPLDERVYLDLGFFQELKQRLGASGDFAQAYVLAHELGHHVQHLLGTDARVRQIEQSNPSRRTSFRSG